MAAAAGDGSIAGSVEGSSEAGEVRLSANQPVNYVTVSFKGLKRVSPHSLIGECEALGYARTLGGVQRALDESRFRLGELGILKSLQSEVSLDPNGVVEIAFTVEEVKRQCTVNANCDKKGDLSCDLRMTQPSLLGGPMSGMVSLGTTPSQTREFLLRLWSPRFLGRRYSWSLDVARATNDEREASSYTEGVTNAVLKLSTPDGSESLSAEAAVRDVFPSDAASGLRLPSLEVQQLRHRSVKTSLRHTAQWAGHLFGLPQTRWTLRNDFEVAGLLGDVSFVRNHLHAASSLRLPQDLTLHLSGCCGLLLPGGNMPSCVSDRFFLGGASGSSATFKGFVHRGLGPAGSCRQREGAKAAKHLSDALGGDCMWSASATLAAPLQVPQRQGEAIDACAFAFLNLGALATPWQLQPGRGHGTAGGLLRALRDGVRASAGLGVGMPIAGMGQLELTFAVPFWAHRHDRRQRLQLGMRLEME